MKEAEKMLYAKLLRKQVNYIINNESGEEIKEALDLLCSLGAKKLNEIMDRMVEEAQKDHEDKRRTQKEL